MNTPKTVLIIDDEEKLRKLLSRILTLEGYIVKEAKNGKEAIALLSSDDILVVLCDVKLPDINGLSLTENIKSTYPEKEIINFTAYGTIPDGVKAIQNGAFGYLTKGDDNDKIIPLLDSAMQKAVLQSKLKKLENKLTHQFGFTKILGQSKSIKNAIDLAKKVSKTDTSVLLLGETGTGKEVFAQAIHYDSDRKNQNFVAINCSALSKEILESELFGHKPGAFTGALKEKKGLFEEANDGTIFLDEIGEMDLDLQAKLLRVLESGSFIKVGGTQTIKVNVRIIAATNKNLQELCNEGKFRLDLFYRISVFVITLPSLNQRPEDIHLLCHYYLQMFSNKVNKHQLSVTPAFLNSLQKHHWRGNVRELKNVIERAVILADSNFIGPELLPFEFLQSSFENSENLYDLQTVEKNHIAKVFHYTKGNKSETAKLLNIGLTTLYRKLEEYKIL